ncbi:MAG: hypothetical protein QM714_15840 [Nocardioides sp.]|uniref:hypothetical protein n=1 Tax=Nocardioides sp. TaxID=35761 RepID=UPI0039E2E53E
MNRLLAIVVALLTAWLGLASPVAAAGAAESLGQAQTYTYDCHTLANLHTQTTSERGPPTTWDGGFTYDAVDRWSCDSSACPDTIAGSVHTNYDDITRSARVTAVRTTTTATAWPASEISALSERASATNAATRANIAGARFAQKSYSEMFSSGGRFAGQSIDDVAGSLRSGALSPKDVPIDVIVRDGNSLILNTRSSQALIRAGVPRSSWNVIDRTGQAAYESRLTGQLTRNGLSSYGTELP